MDKDIQSFVHKEISNVRKQFENEIQKWKTQHEEIMSQKISLEKRLEEVSVLIDEFQSQMNNKTSRKSQEDHKNNDEPLARNRVIIQAEINAHKLNFDSDSNHHSQKEWDEKLAKLENELKQSPN